MERPKHKNPLSLQVNTAVVAGFIPGDFSPAAEADKADFIALRPQTGYWQDAWRRLRRNHVAMAAVVMLLLTVAFAFIGPSLIPYGPNQQIRKSENLNPMQYSAMELTKIETGERVFPHVFGTDMHGRDLLSRTMYATRISLVIGVCAALIVLIIGTIYGSVSGYFGGTADFIMMRVVDVIYALPDILVVLLLSSVIKTPLTNLLNTSHNAAIKSLSSFGAGMISIFIVFGLLYWVGMSRIIRGQVIALKNQEFITAARALGASSARIIRRHLLPNCIGQIIVTAMMQIPSAIFLESFLSFLGLGVNAPTATLGSLCSDSLGGFQTYPSRLLIPSFLLSIVILCFNLFGDGLRDALDPRMKK
ncbi:MAG: ABC transporter permease [Oscillospiraceae bacterium]|jgi:oligopeptide transport system permease protein|nr:ABC transporter permease [Oscillospiraceae bacterium]